MSVIVVDANVVLSGLRSRNGSAHRLLRGMLTARFVFAATPAVVIEYEDLLKRPGILGSDPWISDEEIDLILDAICAQAVLTQPWYRFRPFLVDPKDDLYVECALAAGARTIVTFDKHFQNTALQAFGLDALTPAEFLAR